MATRPVLVTFVAEDAGDGLAKRGAADVLAARQFAVYVERPAGKKRHDHAEHLNTRVEHLRESAFAARPGGVAHSATAFMVDLELACHHSLPVR
jgi:hypothetical protein